MKTLVLLKATVFCLCALPDFAMARGDVSLLVENRLMVPLYYRQSECVQTHCPRSFPTSIVQGSVSDRISARSIRGTGGAMRLDYSSSFGACRFVAQTARMLDGRCDKPVARAFPVKNAPIRCGVTRLQQDSDCNLTVEFFIAVE